VKIENFEKKIQGTVKILGSYKNQHDTFSGSKLLADSKNVHALYVWWSQPLDINLGKRLKKLKISLQNF
jgi:hypothetical protein